MNLLGAGLYALAVWLSVAACQYGTGEARLLLVDIRPAVALVLMLRLGASSWIGIGVVSLLSNLLVGFGSAGLTVTSAFESSIGAVIASAGEVSGPWLVAYAVTRWSDWRSVFDDVRSLAMVALLGAGALTTFVASLQTLAGMAQGVAIDLAGATFLLHASAILNGTLLSAPALLVLARAEGTRDIVRGRGVESCVILTLLLACGVVFLLVPAGQFALGLRLAFAALLLGLWGAVRIGPAFVGAMVFGVGVWVTVATVAGRGPLVDPGPPTTLYRLLEVVVAVVPTVVLLGVVYQRAGAMYQEAVAALDLLAATSDEHGLAIVETDGRGQILAMNRSASRCLNSEERTARGTSAADLFPPDIAAGLRGAMAEHPSAGSEGVWEDIGVFAGRLWRLGRFGGAGDGSPQAVISGARVGSKSEAAPSLSGGERREVSALLASIQTTAADVRPHLKGVVHATSSLDSLVDMGESVRETLAFGEIGGREDGGPVEEIGSSRRRSVLLGARGAHVRSILSGALKGDGFDLAVATTSDEVIDILRRRAGDFSVVILDTDLADDGDASGLVRKVLRRKSSPKAILLADEQPVSLEEDMGDRLHVLCKPFALARLRELMREVLAS